MHPLDPAWEAVKKDFDSACSQSARAARWELTNDLNQLLRRLRQYREEGEWVTTLMEGIARFVPEAAIFEIASPSTDGFPAGSMLRLRAQTGLSLPEHWTFSASDGAAFVSAISSRDPAVALRTASEVTEALAQTAELSAETGRCHVIPLVNGERVAAVLFAAGPEYVDINALELIGGIASIVLERTANRQLHLQVAPAPAPLLSAPPAFAKTAPLKATLPSWADLPDKERARHIQAQRFARVTVAELQLAHPDACHNGRKNANLYLYLKTELEKARENFRKKFMETPSMVDYLHMELVNTAASGDESKLGAEYPGPLV